MALDEFRDVYERHVGFVADGDLRSAMADIAEDRLPKIFEGVTVPQDGVFGTDVVDVRADGDRRVGEAIYQTPDGPVGLRSIWEARGAAWKAVELENFPARQGDTG